MAKLTKQQVSRMGKRIQKYRAEYIKKHPHATHDSAMKYAGDKYKSKYGKHGTRKHKR